MLKLITTNVLGPLTVRSSGVRYEKKIGNMFSSRNMNQIMIAKAQGKPAADVRESVQITRLLIERVSGKQMPNFNYVSNQFSMLKREADAETREFMSLGQNNYGNYLLELPDKPRNVAVAQKFLTWLDTQMTNVPSTRKEPDHG